MESREELDSRIKSVIKSNLISFGLVPSDIEKISENLFQDILRVIEPMYSHFTRGMAPAESINVTTGFHLLDDHKEI